MPITDSTSLRHVVSALRIAENVLAEAKTTVDQLRVHHARAILRDYFPDATLAVYVRAAGIGETSIDLIQLINADGSIVDTCDRYATMLFSTKQREALDTAELAINLIAPTGENDDETLLTYLDRPDEDPETPLSDWFEFQLDLVKQPRGEQTAL